MSLKRSDFLGSPGDRSIELHNEDWTEEKYWDARKGDYTVIPAHREHFREYQDALSQLDQGDESWDGDSDDGFSDSSDSSGSEEGWEEGDWECEEDEEVVLDEEDEIFMATKNATEETDEASSEEEGSFVAPDSSEEDVAPEGPDPKVVEAWRKFHESEAELGDVEKQEDRQTKQEEAKKQQQR